MITTTPMRLVLGLMCGALIAGGLAAPAEALAPETVNPRAIMDAVFARDTGDKIVGQMQIHVDEVGGRAREQRLRTRSMEFEGGTRSLMIFDAPNEVRNTGLLTIDYDDGGRSDDQWLFLPALHRTNRIATSHKSESFMGTDFSYSDLTRQDPNQYEFELVKPSVKVDGQECWKIAATPKSDTVRAETGYTRTVMWVSKAKLMTVQAQAWLADGQSQKLMKSTDVRQIDGIWIAHELTARLVRAGEVRSTTVMKLSHLRLNSDAVSETDFTQRRLEQGL